MTWVEVALCHRKRIHIRINLPSDHLNWGCFQGQRPTVYISFKLSHDGDGHQMHSSAMVVCRLISGSLLPDVCKVGLNASVLYQIRPRFLKKNNSIKHQPIKNNFWFPKSLKKCVVEVAHCPWNITTVTTLPWKIQKCLSFLAAFANGHAFRAWNWFYFFQ